MRILPALLILAASIPAVAFPCSPIEEGSFRLDSFPADGDTFPHDAAPLIRFGDLTDLDFIDDFRPALEGAGDVEVPTTLEDAVRADGFRGSATWTRLFPDDVLPADEDFTLRLIAGDGTAETQEQLDDRFPPVSFRTGRSFVEDEPVAPEFTIEVLDHAATPPVITPCGGGATDAYEETRIHNVTLAGDAGAFDHWRFFTVSDDLGDDLAATNHRVAVEARIATEQSFLGGWSNPPSDADEVCVVAVTEDAYGRTSAASEPICASPAPACAADCSAAGDRTTGGGATLLLLGILGLRRLRR